jgi:hypothetical protein
LPEDLCGGACVLLATLIEDAQTGIADSFAVLRDN